MSTHVIGNLVNGHAVEMEVEMEMEEAVLPLKSGAIKISLSANKQISSSTSQR